jgi:hypothetical protein
MKTNLLSIITFLVFSAVSLAQCTVELNSSTVRVTKDSTIASSLGSGQHYLICSGATLTYKGTQSATVTYYLEENAKVKSERAHVAVVYMKGYAEFDASYTDPAGNYWAITNDAWYMSTSIFTDYLEGSNFNECANVVFNYGSVGNCSATASVSNYNLSESLFIHPNPASEKLRLSFGNDSKKTITISNTLGVVVLEKSTLSKNCEINVSFLNSGPYFVRITDENGSQEVRKIIVKH